MWFKLYVKKGLASLKSQHVNKLEYLLATKTQQANVQNITLMKVLITTV